MADEERKQVLELLAGHDALMLWCRRFLAGHLPDKDQARNLLEAQRQHVQRVREALGMGGDDGA